MLARLYFQFLKFGAFTFGGGWSIVAQMKELYVDNEEKLFEGLREAFLQVSKSDALSWFNSSGYCLQL